MLSVNLTLRESAASILMVAMSICGAKMEGNGMPSCNALKLVALLFAVVILATQPSRNACGADALDAEQQGALDLANKALRTGYQFGSKRMHAEAIDHLNQALEGYDSVYGAKDARSAYVRYLLGMSYFNTRDFDRAKDVLEDALMAFPQSMWQRKEMEHVLYSLGVIYVDKGDYKNAESVLARGVELRVQILKQEDLTTVRMLGWLGVSQMHLRRPEVGAVNLARGLRLLHSLDDTDEACELELTQNLAAAVFQIGDYATAGELATTAIALTEKVHGATSDELAAALREAAVMEQQLGDIKLAEERMLRSLRILESRYGKDAIELVDALVGIAGLANNNDDYDQAKQLVLRCFKICNDSPEAASSEQVALLHSHLAGVLLNCGERTEAQQHATFCIDAVAGRKDECPQEWLAAVRLQGFLAIHRGDYREAVGHFREAVDFCRKVGAKRDTGAFLLNLAEANCLAGKYNAARAALEHARRVVSEDAVGSGRMLIKHEGAAARLAMVQGKYAEATQLLEKALETCRGNPSSNSQNVARALDSLASLHVQLHDGESAERECLEALEIVRRAHGDHHFLAARILSTYGQALAIQWDSIKARENLSAALEAQEHLLGRDHPDTAATRMALAMVLADLGHGERAMEHGSRALADHRAKLGDDHPQTKIAVESLEQIECLIASSAATPAMR